MLSKIKKLFITKNKHLVLIDELGASLEQCPWYELHLSKTCLRFRDPSVLIGADCLQAQVKKDLRPFINLESRADFTYWETLAAL